MCMCMRVHACVDIQNNSKGSYQTWGAYRIEIEHFWLETYVLQNNSELIKTFEYEGLHCGQHTDEIILIRPKFIYVNKRLEKDELAKYIVLRKLLYFIFQIDDHDI